MMTGLARGYLHFLFSVIVCTAIVGKNSVVFLTDEFQEFIVVVVTDHDFGCRE